MSGVVPTSADSEELNVEELENKGPESWITLDLTEVGRGLLDELLLKLKKAKTQDKSVRNIILDMIKKECTGDADDLLKSCSGTFEIREIKEFLPYIADEYKVNLDENGEQKTYAKAFDMNLSEFMARKSPPETSAYAKDKHACELLEIPEIDQLAKELNINIHLMMWVKPWSGIEDFNKVMNKKIVEYKHQMVMDNLHRKGFDGVDTTVGSDKYNEESAMFENYDAIRIAMNQVFDKYINIVNERPVIMVNFGFKFDWEDE